MQYLSTGVVVDNETPPGPRVLRYSFGENAFATVDGAFVDWPETAPLAACGCFCIPISRIAINPPHHRCFRQSLAAIPGPRPLPICPAPGYEEEAASCSGQRFLSVAGRLPRGLFGKKAEANAHAADLQIGSHLGGNYVERDLDRDHGSQERPSPEGLRRAGCSKEQGCRQSDGN